MSTYVLVPGAWLGARAWRETAEALREHGHRVYALSLTGLGERRHLSGPGVDLDTHVLDVVSLVEAEDLRDVVLVGHSYAGVVVTGAADRIGDRLSHVVYVDSAPLGDGQGMFDLMPPEQADELRRQAEASGVHGMPFPGVAALAANGSLEGLGEAERARMEACASPHPFGTYEGTLRLTGEGAGSPKRAVVACRDFRALLDGGNPWIASIIDESWTRVDLDTGHWPMFSAAEELAGALAEVVKG